LIGALYGIENCTGAELYLALKTGRLIAMKIKISISILILILCLFIFLFLVWPRYINLELKGIEFTQDNKTNAENISIKISGQINNKYFGIREFTGQIYCEAVNLKGEYFNLLFDKTNKSYLSITKENGESFDYGEIFGNETMDELVIVKGDNIFVFPAMNRDAAEKTAAKYFKNEYNYHFNGQ
jgi:hypothetical protein